MQRLMLLIIILATPLSGLAAQKTKVLLFGGRGHDWRGFSQMYTGIITDTEDFGGC